MTLATMIRRSFAACLLACLAMLAHAQESELSEYQIKAGMLFNFMRFVDWPQDVGPAYQVCIVGRDPFGQALTALEKKTVQGKELRVRRGIAAENAAGCNVVFISDSEEKRIAATLRALPQRGVLTISDAEGFVDGGGMIGLALVERNVRFDINITAVKQSQLQVSSQLLRLARNVSGARFK